MLKLPEFYVEPSTGGRLTAEALLRSQGSIELTLDAGEFPKEKYCIFHIAADDFWFNLGFIDGELVFQRREFSLRMSEDFFKSLSANKTIVVSWTMDNLTLLLGAIGYQGPDHKKSMRIEPRTAPPMLFKWVRQQSLIPAIEYVSEVDFVARVHSYLAFVQDKINEMVNVDIFWDKIYEGNHIVKRTPKKEQDLHPIILGFLSDQCFIASIEVYPEFTTGVGRLDFLFTGHIQGQGIAKVCAEFKLAHSSDLEHGIEYQLPAYMLNQQTQNGTYCILDFRGEWFKQPQETDLSMHVRLAKAAKRG